MIIEIPAVAQKIINMIETNGYQAYVVGGYVRDKLLGLSPFDCDITTSAKPDDILRIFNEYHCIKNGIKHGTISVVIDKQVIDITTYRIENGYHDRRHPDEVMFVSDLALDLKRRDFTFNALAYHPLRGLIDYYDGISDLNDSILRCIDDPYVRFDEDALRIIRALRFCACYDFKIETNTHSALLTKISLLKDIAIERIVSEFLKALDGPYIKTVIIDYQPVWISLFDELALISECWLTYQLKVNYDRTQELAVRLALFFYPLFAHDQIIFTQLLKRLRLPTKMIKQTSLILKYHDHQIIDKKTLKHLLRLVGLDITKMIIAFNYSCLIFDNDQYDLFNHMIALILDNEIYQLKQLLIKGSDLQALINEKQMIGIILDELLIEVIDDKLENDHYKLLTRASQIYQEKNNAK